MTAPMRLAPVIQPYAWGSPTAFPELFGTPATGEPQAEMWMGAHPAAPSTVGGVPLTELIARDPLGMAGASGPGLPYLLKVLAVAGPLSLQVHPTAEQARAGFAREEAAGVPIGDPARTYRDPFPKPEMVCALTPFHGLCGFRAPDEAADLLESLDIPETGRWVETLRARPAGEALREVFQDMLGDASKDAREAVEHALTGAPSRGGSGPAGGLAVYAELARAYPGDPGVAAALLLNHVRLQPGEAIFLGAGVPHAYLGGVGVEIMANSDNVLRCGLTGKHRDVPELMRIVDFTPAPPHRVRPSADDGRHGYHPPATQFALVRHDLTEGAAHTVPGGVPQILLCTGGHAVVGGLTLGPGESAFVPANAPELPLTGEGTVFRALPGG
ncbi:mannose-6-phosphate isomerase, class I [Nonomuraea ferruginea]|uniref:mannose-6-phosphate isomerase n=1 Tax=Nonomuraea ferruginea TaxID=46174 RepID=A0ABT4T5J7_9ACTN|nr:mannose-6-phosphate isomerase, class I [Nonomuraea ferruginea]MDA0644684.1 mannose-6-phosphate isomerase, class I [Nonomuraea ferruginea]